MSSFHGAFTAGVSCQQGTLTLPDTWFLPLFLTNAYVSIVETGVHEFVSFFDFSPLIPLGTFSVLLLQRWSLDCQDMFVILTMSL